MTLAILVGVDFAQPEFQTGMDELVQLAESAGANVAAVVTCKRRSPDARLFLGEGKADEIAALVKTHEAELVIFNHMLAPAQQRNLEDVFGVRVLDRTGLILDIFALRAQSHEGKLQVELVQLQHLSTRLIRGALYVERQQGGIGLRGPGEKQLELDRRLIGEKVKMLKSRLEKLSRQRQTQRRQRSRTGVFTVAIVGYTNAGKSTLFNALTHGQVYAANQLFATLDTTTRRVYLGEGHHMALSDTVGFIQDLPHGLVEAFKSTLEHTAQADLLLHVVDAASPARHAQMEEVARILHEIGADEVPQWIVWNKADLIGREPEVGLNVCGTMQSVSVSARFGLGLDLLRAALLKAAQEARPGATQWGADSSLSADMQAQPDEGGDAGPEITQE
jgi:GTP-binding protein HflX